MTSCSSQESVQTRPFWACACFTSASRSSLGHTATPSVRSLASVTVPCGACNSVYALCLIAGIANTIDLPERLLLPRILSRMGALQRIPFSPYKREEIEAIVSQRLHHSSIFLPRTVELAARKVRGGTAACRNWSPFLVLLGPAPALWAAADSPRPECPARAPPVSQDESPFVGLGLDLLRRPGRGVPQSAGALGSVR